MPPLLASELTPPALMAASKSVSDIKTLAQDQHTEAMTALFDSGDYSDLTVKCGNRTWQLHRNILCSGSKFFKHACSGNFKEAASGVIELKEDDPLFTGILLRYFYAHGYQIDDNGKPPPLVAHAQVYAIADKYGVGLLKDLAAAKFLLALENIRTTDVPILIAATEVVYTSTLSSDRSLRECIGPKLYEFRQQLRDSDDFMTLFTSGLRDGDFAGEMLDCLARLRPTSRS